MDKFNDVFGPVNRVMFVFAHPDDAEIYSGGTIARLKSEGKIVKLVKMTGGNKGSRDMEISEANLVSKRREEDTQALIQMGLTKEDSTNLEIGDGEVENNLDTIEKLVFEIRKFKPEVIVTHNPSEIVITDNNGDSFINHRDHRNTGMSVVDACYPYSRDNLFFPHQLESFTTHTTTKLLFVDSHTKTQQVLIDVTEYFENKLMAISSHKSQLTEERSAQLANYFAKEVDGKRYEEYRMITID